MFDVVITDGTIIDGTGSPRYRADVGVRADRVVEIGDLKDAESKLAVDASGKIVAPGFIDVHNHSDGWMLKSPHMTSKTLQGFTTEVLMLDGLGYAPVDEQTARQWLFYLRALDGLRMDEYRGWRRIDEFMQSLEGRNVQNAATHVPYANVRSLACGFGKTVVDDFQMRSIQAEIRTGMEQGAVGLSTGLDYIVQCHATTRELIEACSVVAEFDGLYATHVRYKLGRMRAVREAVEIARASGVRLHISHFKGEDERAAEELLEYIDKEARHEVELTFDVYPYQPGSTMLSYLLPYDAWEDGPLGVFSRLHDPRIRARFRDGLNAYRLELDKLTIAWVGTRENKHLQGRLLSDYVEERGVPAEEAIFDLLAEERLAVLLVFNEGDDRVVWPMLQHDLCMMGTDGIHCDEGQVHPRQFGSAGRWLGSCVRDLKLFSLEEAVYKMSGFAAKTFGLKDRGVLSAGSFADVVVFDAETVEDRATYADPQQHSVGVEHVLVNGEPIVREGAALEAGREDLPGRFVRMERAS
ncbi:MAG: N-acyl-D-amino-acid deacylase [Planctomycetaceae bacterium]|nr:N-acyl-D-amino-acid deacylase [Planctomycetaceae bacterium]